MYDTTTDVINALREMTTRDAIIADVNGFVELVHDIGLAGVRRVVENAVALGRAPRGMYDFVVRVWHGDPDALDELANERLAADGVARDVEELLAALYVDVDPMPDHPAENQPPPVGDPPQPASDVPMGEPDPVVVPAPMEEKGKEEGPVVPVRFDAEEEKVPVTTVYVLPSERGGRIKLRRTWSKKPFSWKPAVKPPDITGDGRRVLYRRQLKERQTLDEEIDDARVMIAYYLDQMMNAKEKEESDKASSLRGREEAMLEQMIKERAVRDRNKRQREEDYLYEETIPIQSQKDMALEDAYSAELNKQWAEDDIKKYEAVRRQQYKDALKADAEEYAARMKAKIFVPTTVSTYKRERVGIDSLKSTGRRGHREVYERGNVAVRLDRSEPPAVALTHSTLGWLEKPVIGIGVAFNLDESVDDAPPDDPSEFGQHILRKYYTPDTMHMAHRAAFVYEAARERKTLPVFPSVQEYADKAMEYATKIDASCLRAMYMPDIRSGIDVRATRDEIRMYAGRIMTSMLTSNGIHKIKYTVVMPVVDVDQFKAYVTDNIDSVTRIIRENQLSFMAKANHDKPINPIDEHAELVEPVADVLFGLDAVPEGDESNTALLYKFATTVMEPSFSNHIVAKTMVFNHLLNNNTTANPNPKDSEELRILFENMLPIADDYMTFRALQSELVQLEAELYRAVPVPRDSINLYRSTITLSIQQHFEKYIATFLTVEQSLAHLVFIRELLVKIRVYTNSLLDYRNEIMKKMTTGMANPFYYYVWHVALDDLAGGILKFLELTEPFDMYLVSQLNKASDEIKGELTGRESTTKSALSIDAVRAKFNLVEVSELARPMIEADRSSIVPMHASSAKPLTIMDEFSLNILTNKRFVLDAESGVSGWFVARASQMPRVSNPLKALDAGKGMGFSQALQPYRGPGYVVLPVNISPYEDILSEFVDAVMAREHAWEMGTRYGGQLNMFSIIINTESILHRIQKDNYSYFTASFDEILKAALKIAGNVDPDMQSFYFDQLAAQFVNENTRLTESGEFIPPPRRTTTLGFDQQLSVLAVNSIFARLSTEMENITEAMAASYIEGLHPYLDIPAAQIMTDYLNNYRTAVVFLRTGDLPTYDESSAVLEQWLRTMVTYRDHYTTNTADERSAMAERTRAFNKMAYRIHLRTVSEQNVVNAKTRVMEYIAEYYKLGDDERAEIQKVATDEAAAVLSNARKHVLTYAEDEELTRARDIGEIAQKQVQRINEYSTIASKLRKDPGSSEVYIAAGELLLNRTTKFTRPLDDGRSITDSWWTFRQPPTLAPSFAMQHVNYEFVLESVKTLTRMNIKKELNTRTDTLPIPPGLVLQCEVAGLTSTGSYIPIQLLKLGGGNARVSGKFLNLSVFL
jgi:hypothetical protein